MYIKNKALKWRKIFKGVVFRKMDICPQNRNFEGFSEYLPLD